MRGFEGVFTANEFADWVGCGVVLAACGDPSGTAPNCILLPPLGFPTTGPPFDKYPDAPAALIVTEGFRLCSPGPEVELVGVLPLIIVDVFTAGTAGGIAVFPLTGEVRSGLPWCELPTAVEGVEPPDAEEGADVFLVALA